jgi:Txe/YoeB family toxin of toxin-antitoxin system
MYTLLYTRQAQEDAKKLAGSNLKKKAEEVLRLLEKDPFIDYPPYEKLLGDLTGAYSRRINLQHRIVYQVCENERKIKIIRMWSHYE